MPKKTKKLVSAEVLKSANTHKERKETMPACRLSPSCAQYCEALRDPFSAVAPWIPSFPSKPCLTVPVRFRGSFTVGTGGWGWIAVKIPAFLFDDVTGCAFTDALYAGTGATALASGAGVLTAAPNSPFASAEFGTLSFDAKARVVAAGLRVWYAGTVLNEGGTMYIGTMVDNDVSVFNASVTIDQLSSANSTAFARADESVFQVTWLPTDMINFDFLRSDQMAQVYPTYALVNGTPGNVYQVEIVVHWEVSKPMGLWAQGLGLTTRNQTAQQIVHPADPMGMMNVTAAHQQLRQTSAPSPYIRSVAEVAASMKEIASNVAQTVNYAAYVGQFAAGALGYAQRFRHQLAFGRPAHPGRAAIREL